MPTTTTTVTVTTAEEGVPPITTTTTTTASRQLLPGMAKCSLVIRANVGKVVPLIGFDTVIEAGPLASIVTCEYTDGDSIGSVRHITGVPGGPFDGKILSETCLDNVNGHTYALNLGEWGSATYAMPVEVGGYVGTFSAEEVDASTCVLVWCAHYQSSDPALIKGMLEEMIGGSLAAIAEQVGGAAGGAVHLGYTLGTDPRMDSRVVAPFAALGMADAPMPCPVTRANTREEILAWSQEIEAGFVSQEFP